MTNTQHDETAQRAYRGKLEAIWALRADDRARALAAAQEQLAADLRAARGDEARERAFLEARAQANRDYDFAMDAARVMRRGHPGLDEFVAAVERQRRDDYRAASEAYLAS